MKNDVSVGIIYKHRFEPAKKEAEKLVTWLNARGINTFSEEMGPNGQKESFDDFEFLPVNDLKWIVVLGGGIIGASPAEGRDAALTSSSLERVGVQRRRVIDAFADDDVVVAWIGSDHHVEHSR